LDKSYHFRIEVIFVVNYSVLKERLHLLPDATNKLSALICRVNNFLKLFSKFQSASRFLKINSFASFIKRGNQVISTCLLRQLFFKTFFRFNQSLSTRPAFDNRPAVR